MDERLEIPQQSKKEGTIISPILQIRTLWPKVPYPQSGKVGMKTQVVWLQSQHFWALQERQSSEQKQTFSILSSNLESRSSTTKEQVNDHI